MTMTPDELEAAVARAYLEAGGIVHFAGLRAAIAIVVEACAGIPDEMEERARRLCLESGVTDGRAAVNLAAGNIASAIRHLSKGTDDDVR